MSVVLNSLIPGLSPGSLGIIKGEGLFLPVHLPESLGMRLASVSTVCRVDESG